MTYIDDLRADWQNATGVQSGTYTVRSDGSTVANVRANLDPDSPSYGTVDGPATVGVREAVWFIWDVTLGRTPDYGDSITVAGVVWIIQTFQAVAEEGTVVKWRCDCRAQRT